MLTFSTLMNGRKSAEIFCLYTGKLARRLTVKGDVIEIDAMTIKVEVRMTTPIVFNAWVFDRGDMTFYAPDLAPPIGTVAKLCGEGDPIKFDDGTESHVMPQ
jgi:hypothetical protein